MGIGCRRDPLEANVWYVKAAEAGDERAKHRLQAIRAAASGAPMPLPNGAGKGKKDKDKKGGDGPESPKKDDKECIVM
jgi:TPR repeat protein